MVDTLYRDGNNNLQTLKTLTATDGSTLPQSAPSDPTGKPYGTANPLPVVVSGTVSTLQQGQGPTPIDISVSVVAAQDSPAPDLELATRNDDLLELTSAILRQLLVLNCMLADQCGVDVHDLIRNIEESQQYGTRVESNTTN